MKVETIKDTIMNVEHSPRDFSYLKEWSREQLKNRLGQIMPTVDFLVSMYNANDKVVKLEMSYVTERAGLDLSVPSKVDPRDYSDVKDHSIHFDTLKLSGFGFPPELELFIHNLCTVLCAEKMHIELLLSE